MKVTKGDKLPEVAPDHPDWPLGSMLLMEALGTVSIDFFAGSHAAACQCRLVGS